MIKKTIAATALITIFTTGAFAGDASTQAHQAAVVEATVNRHMVEFCMFKGLPVPAEIQDFNIHWLHTLWDNEILDLATSLNDAEYKEAYDIAEYDTSFLKNRPIISILSRCAEIMDRTVLLSKKPENSN